MDRAEALLNEALELNPNYVDAMALMADVYEDRRSDQWPERQEEFISKIQLLRQRVLELDPANMDVLTAIATETAFRKGDIVGAARLYEQASRIEPSNFKVLWGCAMIARGMGRTDLAIRFLEYVTERDPMNLAHHNSLAHAYADVGRFDDALRQFALARSLIDREEAFRWSVGIVRLASGDAAGALESFDGVPDDLFRTHGRVLALYDLGREDESAEVLRELHAMHQEQIDKFGDKFDDPANSSFAFMFATANAWTGKNDEAFNYMRTAADLLDGASLPGVVENKLFVRLHSDERWLPFLRSIGQAPEQLAEFEFNPTLPVDLNRSL